MKVTVYVKAFTKAVLNSFGKVTGAKAKKSQDQRTQSQGRSPPTPFLWRWSDFFFFHLLCHAAGLLEMYLGDRFVLTHTECYRYLVLSLHLVHPELSQLRCPEAIYALTVQMSPDIVGLSHRRRMDKGRLCFEVRYLVPPLPGQHCCLRPSGPLPCLLADRSSPYTSLCPSKKYT